MNHTQNLNLPQFAETDRIHHDDFNEAFDKIDAAVPAMPVCKLMDFTTTEATAGIEINFHTANIDTTQYAQLKIICTFRGGGYYVRINNQAGGYRASSSFSGAPSSESYLLHANADTSPIVADITITAVPEIDVIGHMVCGMENTTVTGSYGSCRLGNGEDLESIQFVSSSVNNQFAAGAHIVVYGLRA